MVATMKSKETDKKEKVHRRKLRNLPKAIFGVSLLWILGIFVWFPFHWDFSQFLIYLVVGIGGIGFSIYSEWLIRNKMDFNKQIEAVKEELNELDKTVSSLSNWTTKQITEINNKKIH